MAETLQVVAFEGGELRARGTEIAPGEAVLALPLSRLLVKMVKVPAGEDPVAVASPVLAALSPYPDEPLSVSCETVRETDEGRIVLAAALPESSADDIASALDAAKVNVTRIDSLALGALRGLWSKLSDGRTDVRRLLLLKSVDCLSLFVLDDDQPSAVRAITSDDDLRREAMLSLLEAEDFGGAKALAETVVVGDVDTSVLETFAPVRRLTPEEDLSVLALVGAEERAVDPSALDVLPASWREVLYETRFKAKLKKFLAISGGIWALVMAVLFGVPVVFGLLTDHQKGLSKEHAKTYNAVKEMRDKVKLVQKYSDHSRGALEIMRVVTECLPLPEDAESSCIELNSWNFKREDGVKFGGEADSAALVYEFKNTLIECGVFAQVNLQGPSAGKGGRQRFDIDCRFAGEDEK